MANKKHTNRGYNVGYDKNSSKTLPQDDWQVNINLTPQGNNTYVGAWNPIPGKERPTTHVKINECDH